MAIEKPMRIPVNGTWEEFNPQTSLNMIKDMSSFIKQLSVASDAESARKVLDAAATNHGIHVPAGGTNTQFLRGDLTWQSIQTVIGQGFVAQSLQQNGWVKAANGLIIQWGNANNGGKATYVGFNIAFNSIPTLVVSSKTNYGNGITGEQSTPCYRTVTNTGFVFCSFDNYNGVAGSSYIALGT